MEAGALILDTPAPGLRLRYGQAEYWVDPDARMKENLGLRGSVRCPDACEAVQQSSEESPLHPGRALGRSR